MQPKWLLGNDGIPGHYDAGCFYDADSDGYFSGTINRMPIVCISAVAYRDKFGFYIVKPEFRGKGYGIQLWNTAIDYLKRVECIGLDGVIDQQKNYMESGFKLYYRNIRFDGKAA